MSRRSRKSKRRIHSLYMMLLLTAILLILSSYAWFSANREVSITGITAHVSAAEGLQISLDGVAWGSSVAVNESNLANAKAESTEYTVNNYTWPDQLEPVSTDGTFTGADINFYSGDISANGATLSGVTAATTTSNKYIAFDIYLKNASSKATDNLQLSTGSYVKINKDEGKTDTGLEYSTRTGMLLYSNTAVFTAAQKDIVTLASGTPLAAIWEPNYNKHIAEIVKNDPRIDAEDTVFNTLGLTAKSSGNDVADANRKEIKKDGDDGYLAAPVTIKTDGENGTVTNMLAVDGTTQLELKPNTIMKARMYIWLEGQDPDCQDTASTGKAFDIQFNLTKPAATAP